MKGLPEGWGLFRLAEISLVEMGQSPESVNYNINGIGLPFFQGKAEFRQTFPEIKKWCSSPTKTAETGDILLSIRAPVGPTNLAPTKCCIGRGLAAIHSEAGIDQGYIYYFFKSIEPWLSRQGTGSTFSAISGQFVKDIEIPIPPAAEQTRIVTKLEELLSDLDAGVAELKAAQKKLVQYRQSLLKAAVEGKLTQHWREQHCAPSPQPLSHQGRGALGVDGVNDAAANYRPHLSDQNVTSQEHPPEFSNPLPSTTLPSPFVGEGPGERGQEALETGAQLLARILKQRRANWETKQLAKFQQQGKTPPKGWQDKYPEPVKPDTSDLPSLPEGWVWASVDQVAEVFLGKMLDKTKHTSGTKMPYLRNVNIRWGNIQTHDISEMFFENDELERYGLLAGDVLVCEGGEPGRAAICNKEHEILKYQKALHRVRLFDLYEPEFLVAFLEFSAKTGRLEKTFTGSTINHLTKESFLALQIPIAPLNEQREIVETLQLATNTIDEQKLALDVAFKQSAAQRQNILRAAFSGQLVPQDPNDEPASVLLERIRAERAAQQADKTPKKRSTKTAS